jgi:hypothetical protein
MRGWRKYLIGAVAGAVLMLSGQAIADIPDGTKLYFCVYNEAIHTGPHPWQVLDKSAGERCNFGWTERSVTVLGP